MSDLVRLGRGGAGNFYSQKDVEEAEKAQAAIDPESLKPAQGPAPDAAAQAPQYVRSGRGGAGNYQEPPTAAESQEREDVVDKTKAAVTASQAGKPRAGLTGRGGAGNWQEDGATTGGVTGTHAKQQQIEDQVRNDIAASLPPPPKTYHQHNRDME